MTGGVLYRPCARCCGLSISIICRTRFETALLGVKRLPSLLRLIELQRKERPGDALHAQTGVKFLCAVLRWELSWTSAIGGGITCITAVRGGCSEAGSDLGEYGAICRLCATKGAWPRPVAVIVGSA